MVEIEEALADSCIQEEFARPVRKQGDEVSFLRIVALQSTIVAVSEPKAQFARQNIGHSS